jgi:hypothetical protein
MTSVSNKPSVMVLEGIGNPVGKSPHAHNVARSAQRLNPKTDSVAITFQQVSRIPNVKTNSIQSEIEALFSKGLTEFANDLNAIARSKNKPQAVNCSFGFDELGVLKALQKKPKLYFGKATQAEQTNLFDLNKKESHGYVWKLPELESYIDKTLAESNKIAEAKEKATQAVAGLKKLNIPVIVGSGNSNDDIEAFKNEHPDVQFESDEGQSMYANLGTITVGASNPDGTLTEYSSRGPEVDFTTQVPPSIRGRSNLRWDDKKKKATGNLRTKGTSFTAPVVAAMYAKLIAKGMKVDEATAYLKKLGTPKKDDTSDQNPYTDLNLAAVQQNPMFKGK